jgi:transposase
MSVHRAWQRYDLQPHRVEKFKLSNDPHFETKVRDVVGLYLNPPARALVLCVDEKSQIQALDRTAPILPLRPGLPERQTHDYIRHGTTTLFAAFNILTGKVIGQCLPRHRGREFVIFLRQLEQVVPPDLQVHLILDNYSTHKCPPVQRWLKPQKRQRFHFHFTPTSSSWLNQVERWFAEITRQQIRRGSFHSVKELETTIYQYLAAWNQTPKPFVWIAISESAMPCQADFWKHRAACRTRDTPARMTVFSVPLRRGARPAERRLPVLVRLYADRALLLDPSPSSSPNGIEHR